MKTNTFSVLVSKNRLKLIVLIISILFGCNLLSFSQTPLYWRYWHTEDGLWDARTSKAVMGKEGKLWITHGAVEKMSIFDGYTFEYIPSPGQEVPVYKCSSGQIWSYFYDNNSSTGGLLHYVEGKWQRYTIDGILSLSSSFYPLNDYFVLCLTSSGIILYNAATNQITEVKNVKDSILGNFLELAPSLDGFIWISCEEGLVKLSGFDPPDMTSLEWDIFPFSNDLDIENLSHIVAGEKSNVFGRALLTSFCCGKGS